MWGPNPLGPYSLRDAQAALASWNPATGGQFSLGIMQDERLLGAVGLIPERPGSIELAYWLRPEARGRGIASRAVLAATQWTNRELAVPRIWLEIEPGNEPSPRLAQRVGYELERRVPRHCRAWTHDDPERDTWHDCIIWGHEQHPNPGHERPLT